MTTGIGQRVWIVPGGRIPLRSTGREPEMTSRDELRLLNTNGSEVDVEITVLYADAEPVGPYQVRVAGQRVRSVRVNDLIDPLPVPLDTDYALMIRATAPIVVQFTRLDSSSAANAQVGTIAFPT